LKHIKNIIFDLDGTLIDSSEGVVAAVNHALTRAGDPLPPPEQIKSFIGYSLHEMFPHFSKRPTDELCAFFQEKANGLVIGATEALPGTDAVLALLRQQGYRLAIATTKHRRNVEGILDKLHWREHFATFACGNEVTRVKPDPEIIRLALSRFDASPDDTVVIGDTINDILAARAIPMLSIAVASPFESKEKVMTARPDYFAESIDDIPVLLGNKK